LLSGENVYYYTPSFQNVNTFFKKIFKKVSTFFDSIFKSKGVHEPSAGTTKPVLKRFRVQGAFLKSPLVAPAGAKYPSGLTERTKIGLKSQTIDGRQEF